MTLRTCRSSGAKVEPLTGGETPPIQTGKPMEFQYLAACVSIRYIERIPNAIHSSFSLAAVSASRAPAAAADRFSVASAAFFIPTTATLIRGSDKTNCTASCRNATRSSPTNSRNFASRSSTDSCCLSVQSQAHNSPFSTRCSTSSSGSDRKP